MPSGHFIGGRFVQMSGEKIQVSCPSDGRHLGTLDDAGENGVDEAAKDARNALARSSWATANPRERGRALCAFADAIEAQAERLAMIEAVGSSRLLRLTRTRDITRTAGVIRYYGEFCDKLDGSLTPAGNGVMSAVRNEPYGVVAGIVPWNFPIITAAWKFAPALAAGNAVVMKTSELTPHSLLAVAEIACQAGLPPGLLNVVNGYGATTGAALVRHPEIGMVSFTGSTKTGADIMSLAAYHGIKPVSLELGGKGPQLVCADPGDLDDIAGKVAAGFIDNAGQVCTAGSRLIVHESIADALLERIEQKCRDVHPGRTWDDATTLAPVISAGQLARISTLVNQTVAEGATVRIGGAPIPSPYGSGHFHAPTILENVGRDMTGFREEFFGPILIVDRFRDFEEGLAKTRHPVYGLSANVYTRSLPEAMRAVETIEAGMIWVNQPGRAPEFTFPAGGFRSSGFGKDMGREGLLGFTRQKAAWINYAA